LTKSTRLVLLINLYIKCHYQTTVLPNPFLQLYIVMAPLTTVSTNGQRPADQFSVV